MPVIILKKVILVCAVLTAIGLIFKYSFYSLPRNHGHVETQLFIGQTEDQPLVVVFGGSEGGNIFASDQLKPERDKFIERGYAVLAVAYFRTNTTPASLDRISLNAIHDSITSIVTRHPSINENRIALYGGSRGGELALNLASRYPDYNAVIAISPSSVSLPTRFGWGATSSWSFFDAEVPYLSGDNKKAGEGFFNELSSMLEDEQAAERAAIPVEKINGPILLVSAKSDEVWPSTLMCNSMVERLKSKDFSQHVEHIGIEGAHADAAKNSEYVFDFLEKHWDLGRE
jgi:pimeloyl-ACP methyl ester carboxylesterase